jgi:hypothetical protein
MPVKKPGFHAGFFFAIYKVIFPTMKQAPSPLPLRHRRLTSNAWKISIPAPQVEGLDNRHSANSPDISNNCKSAKLQAKSPKDDCPFD